MPLAGGASLFFTVVLLVTTTYFIMGGLPLLILKHDTPIDGKFIRRFFDVYYKAAGFAAIGATLSYALWGRLFFALGAAVFAVTAVVLHRRVVPAMERLAARIHANDTAAITTFRKVHSVTLLANVVLLVLLVWGVTKISL